MNTDEPGRRVTTRTELLSLLSDACELEHSLACCYLYAAFSLKQDVSEGGIDWKQLQQIRLWAAQLYFIASQEMLHLAQVWNLLAAVGGTPYYMRPSFPQNNDYYPLGLPLRLDPFGLATIRRFAAFERPADQSPAQIRALDEFAGIGDTASFDFNTVGALYGLIESAIVNIDSASLFVPAAGAQIDASLIDFPNIVTVTGRASAVAAIRMITSQGEGIRANHLDCHFGVFKGIIRAVQALQAEVPGFAPARVTISNPTLATRPDGNAHADARTLITVAHTAAVAEHFDAVYVLMLRLLQYVFDRGTSDPTLLKDLSRLALELMVRIVKPLGEALTLLPAGDPVGRAAGAPFTVDRHVALPLDAHTAALIVAERLHEIKTGLRPLADEAGAPAQLRHAAANLEQLATNFRTHETPSA